MHVKSLVCESDPESLKDEVPPLPLLVQSVGRPPLFVVRSGRVMTILGGAPASSGE